MRYSLARIRFMLEKEFRQIFRNRAMLPILFLMPVIQLVLLSNVATFELKSIQLWVVDADGGPTALRLRQQLLASGHFVLVGQSAHDAPAFAAIERDAADLILHIPAHFGCDLARQRTATVLLSANAINGVKAGLAQQYAGAIVQQFGARLEPPAASAASAAPADFDLRYRHWYNPRMDYKTLMVPGILVMLVTMTSLFLSSMNVVRERELGTIEQINVTPISKHDFLIGKVLPFWLLSLFNLTVGLLVAVFIFRVPLVGSVGVIYAFAAVYLLATLGMGTFISTFADTQQQAMFLTWFFTVIFIIISGLFSPIEAMPGWAQALTKVNPIAYFVEVMRMVMLKGAGLAEVRTHFAVMAAFAVGFNALAILSYGKRAG